MIVKREMLQWALNNLAETDDGEIEIIEIRNGTLVGIIGKVCGYSRLIGLFKNDAMPPKDVPEMFHISRKAAGLDIEDKL